MAVLPSTGRPKYHFVAPQGFMNDPCAPGYDPATGTFHLSYQWTPYSHQWNKIAWGHATSTDLLNWTHGSADTPILKADQEYDSEGVFTGCFMPVDLQGQPGLSVFYTNVNAMPLHWTVPYTRGSEGIAAATSSDGGKTWTKLASNPILKEEPKDMHVTGWRDPFVAPWPAMDAARATTNGLYALVAGGIHDVGPRLFLYAIKPNDLTKWTYLHTLIDVPANTTPGGDWGGDLGVNFECTNFLTLSADGIERQVMIACSEGGKERPWITAHAAANPAQPRRLVRYANWFFTTLTPGEPVATNIGAAGLVDWGLLYATNSFQHPDGRHVVWGWAIEEDLDDAILAKRGWTGNLGIPREVFLQVRKGVVGGLISALEEIGSLEVAEKHGEEATIATLGIRPLAELSGLRGPALHDAESTTFKNGHLLSAPLCYELATTVAVTPTSGDVVLTIRHTPDATTRTTITFSPTAETITVDRTASSADEGVLTSPEVGKHTLFRTSDEIEALTLRVFVDHDMVEVFANERFAIATRVYSPAEACGVSLDVGTGVVETLSIWEINGEVNSIA